MSQRITSVTYRRYRNRTIFSAGLFSRVQTAENAGGLRETLCPELALALAGGRLLARGTSPCNARFRRHFPVAGGGHFERAHPAPGPNAGRSPPPFMLRHRAMHPRPAKGRG